MSFGSIVSASEVHPLSAPATRLRGEVNRVCGEDANEPRRSPGTGNQDDFLRHQIAHAEGSLDQRYR
jgi:hypothetical protein